MAFPHESVRDAIRDWEAVGELVRVKKEVDWNLEAGAITRRVAETNSGKGVKNGGQPTILFEKIKGYSQEHSILANIMTNITSLAMIFGHPDPEKATLRELQDIFLYGLDHPIKPMVVKNAPCKENKAFGDQCNLLQFPAPMIHEGDGGRYMCSWHLVNIKDRSSDWQNWGMYRLMVHDKRSLGALLVHGQQGGDMYYDQYERANEPMPFAIAINPDPLTAFAAATPIPRGVSEADVIGGWRKRPLNVVKCETNDLLVPATAEIVIEGVVPPKIRAYEGPFGEYTGFRASPRDLRPVFVVRCITWRNNPIMGMSNMGLPVAESNFAHTVGRAALHRRDLLQAGWPVVDVNVPLECSDLIAVSVRKGRPRVAQGVMGVLLSSTMGVYTSKVLVCDDDVDVFNLNELVVSMVEKVHPDRGITVYHHQGSPLAPYAGLNERLTQTAPQVLFDATWPPDWPPEIAVPPKSCFKELYPKKLQEKVLNDWKSYGLK